MKRKWQKLIEVTKQKQEPYGAARFQLATKI